jgi:hypothetical protein
VEDLSLEDLLQRLQDVVLIVQKENASHRASDPRWRRRAGILAKVLGPREPFVPGPSGFLDFHEGRQDARSK